NEKEATEFDETLHNFAKETVEKYEASMEKMQFSIVLGELWAFISRTNKYIDETQPWVLAKEESSKGQLAAVMTNLAESLRQIATLIQPFMTNSPKEIISQLGLKEEQLNWDLLGSYSVIEEGTEVIKTGVPIFPRLDVEVEVAYIREQMRGSVQTPQEEEVPK